MNKILFFIFLLNTSLVNAKNCNLEPSKGSINFVIGYGSLMEEKSRTRTNPAAKIAKPIMVKGFERIWGHNGGNYKITFLTIIKKKNSEVNAVYYPISASGLKKLDRRESSYCRIKVSRKDLNFYDEKIKNDNSSFWIYAANPKRLKNPTEEHPIVQSYVDIFMNGCLQIQKKYSIKDFANACIETTKGWSPYWVNDRIHSRRPFQVSNAYKIDQHLSKYFDHYYKHKIE
tara:strand:- start:23 stop:712 length:690 start_codon:yes stop_codon:yes gene_type:complete